MEPIEILFVIAVLIIPALAISARIALGPIVDALLRLQEGLSSAFPARDPEEVRRLRAQLEEVEGRLASLEEATDFHLELTRGSGPASRRLPGDDGPEGAGGESVDRTTAR